TSVDGTASTVTITINGTNDAATVSTASQVLTETDAALTTSGTLTSTDVDNPDNAFNADSTVGTIGTFTIDAAGAWDFTTNSAFDSLNVGDNVNETFNVTSVDGTASTVTITINGTNDAATVSTASQVLTETDAALTTSGTLTSTDVDNPDNTFTADTIVGTIGTFTIDAAGAWDFTANSAFDSLNVGDNVNETYNVTSVDGTASTVTITINGTNDAATVSTASQTLTETDVALTTSGTLTSTDVDNPDDAFTADTIVGTIGTFNIDAAGAWDFTANSAFDSLNVGDNVNETFNVTSIDGTASTVTITINGTNDAATV
ncbi:MAG: toxin, partial [Actinomycetia bacterium]|nr:toxin [Actinomycetes bacterium]